MRNHNFSITKFVLGPISTNCYLLACNKTKEAAIIDPAEEDNAIFDKIEDENYSLKYVINTHGHFDHIGGNKILKEKYCAKILIHRSDENMIINPQLYCSFKIGNTYNSPPADKYLEDGMVIKIGEIEISILHTPGHSPGSVSLIVDKNIFTGDTLFANGIGRTDLTGGSMEQIMHSIKEKLKLFNDDYTILPGHGSMSTIGEEMRNNPWLQ
jgi:glyoxylase-like metal-dependent hydrolase (beta-lactamase superfamily II)